MKCQNCNGNGQVQVGDSAHVVSCKECGGLGEVRDLAPFDRNTQLTFEEKKRIGSLTIDALVSTQRRGHALTWKATDLYRSTGTCSKCGMQVTINIHPRPNEIDIGGEALALNCKE